MINESDKIWLIGALGDYARDRRIRAVELRNFDFSNCQTTASKAVDFYEREARKAESLEAKLKQEMGL